MSGLRAALVDSLAALVFFTAVAGLTEYLVAGLSPAQVLVSRLAMVPVLLLTGRPYGVWRDAVLARTGARGRLAALGADTAAFLSFQVPLYAAVLWLAGADAGQAAAAISSAMVAMAVLGRPYGQFLERVRRFASVWSAAPAGAMGVGMTGTRATTRRRRR